MEDTTPCLGGSIKSDISDDDLVYEAIGQHSMRDVNDYPTNFLITDHTYSCRTQGNRGTCAAFVGATIKEIQSLLATKQSPQPSDKIQKPATHAQLPSSKIGLSSSRESPEKQVDTITNKEPSVSRDLRKSKLAKTTSQSKMEVALEVPKPKFNSLSPEFIYHHRKNKPMDGMSGKDVLSILKEIGTVPEKYCPYAVDNAPSSKIDTLLYTIASSYRIAGYARVSTVMGLKNALMDLFPGYLLLPSYNDRPNFWIRPTDNSKAVGHAVTVVGFTNEGFMLRNSWGPTWNGNGHVVLPYSDWHYVWECWIAIDDNVDQPARTTTPSKNRKKRVSLTL